MIPRRIEGKPVLVEVERIDGKAKCQMIEELEYLLEETKQGRLIGFSYAATLTTPKTQQQIVGLAGTHCEVDKAVASLFRAAVSLTMSDQT